MNHTILSIEQVHKSFGRKKVLQNLNLTINQGDLIYIKGHNGSGKSTLLKIICEILKQDSGTINRDPQTTIGALIENPAFIESKPIKYNLKFLADFNHNYDYKVIDKLCQRFNLSIEDKTVMSKYSVGMRQKTGIIQAIMENQTLILLDEPTRGLDDEAVQTFVEIVQEMIAQNKSIIITAHDKIPTLNYTAVYELINGQLK